jgi:hypothetical protein
MRRRNLTVDELLAAFKSLTPTEQDTFVRNAYRELTPSQQLHITVDVLGDPNGSFRELLRTTGGLYQALLRHHQSPKAKRNAEIVERASRGESQGSIALDLKMNRPAVAAVLRRARRKSQEASAQVSLHRPM